jgi:uncharacterized SAM-binding protein YcdF (DUF218 family)
LNQAEAEHIVHYLDLQAPPGSADLAFVFGTRHADPAHIAAELLENGKAKYAVLTGGAKLAPDTCEAMAHRAIMLHKGIPDERIILECASTNTLENVSLALPEIARRVGLDAIESIVAIAKWYHCRRAVMTLRRYLHAGIRYYTRTYEPAGFSRAEWHLRPEVARRVLKEWESIPRYLERGDIAEIRRLGDAFV